MWLSIHYVLSVNWLKGARSLILSHFPRPSLQPRTTSKCGNGNHPAAFCYSRPLPCAKPGRRSSDVCCSLWLEWILSPPPLTAILNARLCSAFNINKRSRQAGGQATVSYTRTHPHARPGWKSAASISLLWQGVVIMSLWEWVLFAGWKMIMGWFLSAISPARVMKSTFNPVGRNGGVEGEEWLGESRQKGLLWWVVLGGWRHADRTRERMKRGTCVWRCGEDITRRKKRFQGNALTEVGVWQRGLCARARGMPKPWHEAWAQQLE